MDDFNIRSELTDNLFDLAILDPAPEPSTSTNEISNPATEPPTLTNEILSPYLPNKSSSKRNSKYPFPLNEIRIVLKRCDDSNTINCNIDSKPLCKNAVSQLKSKNNRIIKHSCVLCCSFEDTLNQPQHLSATASKTTTIQKRPVPKSSEITKQIPICNVCSLCGDGFVMPHSLGTDTWENFNKNSELNKLNSINTEDFTQVSEMEYFLRNQMKAFEGVAVVCKNNSKYNKRYQNFAHCPHCPMTYRRSDFLQNHIIVHTDEVPFSMICEFCYQFFSNIRNLQRHIQRMHREESENLCYSSSSSSASDCSNSDSGSSSSRSSSPILDTDIPTLIPAQLKLLENKSKVVIRVPTTSNKGEAKPMSNYESFLFNLKESKNPVVPTSIPGYSETDWKRYINNEYPQEEHNYTLRDRGSPYRYSPVARINPEQIVAARCQIDLNEMTSQVNDPTMSTVFPEIISDFDPVQYEDIPMLEIQNNTPPNDKYCISLSPDIVMNIHQEDHNFCRVIQVVEAPNKPTCSNSFNYNKVKVIKTVVKRVRVVRNPFIVNSLTKKPFHVLKDYSRFKHVSGSTTILKPNLCTAETPVQNLMKNFVPTGKKDNLPTMDNKLSSVELSGEPIIEEIVLDCDSSNVKTAMKIQNEKSQTSNYEYEVVTFSESSTKESVSLKTNLCKPSIPEVSTEMDFKIEISSEDTSLGVKGSESTVEDLKLSCHPKVVVEKLPLTINSIQKCHTINNLNLSEEMSCSTLQLPNPKRKRNIIPLTSTSTCKFKSYPVVTLEKLKNPMEQHSESSSKRSSKKMGLAQKSKEDLSCQRICTCKCLQCGLICINTSSLKSHVQFYAGKKHFCCFRCNKVFGSVTQLKLHQCYSESTNYCERCPMAFRNQTSLSYHTMFHLFCRHCGKIFQNDLCLENHLKEVYLSRCRKCDVQSSEKDIQKKVEVCSYQSCKSVKCKYCNKVFTSNKECKKHTTDHLHVSEGMFICRLCCLNYFTSLELEQHMSAKHFRFHYLGKTDKTKNPLSKPVVVNQENKTSISSVSRPFYASRRSLRKNVIQPVGGEEPRINLGLSFKSEEKCKSSFRPTVPNEEIKFNLPVKTYSKSSASSHPNPKNSNNKPNNSASMEDKEHPKEVLQKRKLNFPNILKVKKLKPSNKDENDDSDTSVQFGKNISNDLDMLLIPCLVDHGYFKNQRIDSCITDTTSVSQVIKNSLQTVDESPQCKQCSLFFASESMLRKHRALKHNKPYQCNLCYLVFSLEENFQKHVLLHLDKNMVICAVCARVYAKLKDLKNHFQCKHGMPSQFDKHICAFTMQVFVQNQEQLCSFKCSHCGITYKSKLLIH